MALVRNVNLPMLPGYNFNFNVSKERYPRPHFFDHFKEFSYLTDKVRRGIGPPKYPSVYPRGVAPDLPSWIVFDKQVLRFDAFFQESITEFPGCHYNIRKCKILFYLEDGTIEVSEPTIANSGILQGVIISRKRVPFSAPRDREFYDVLDFNVGNEVDLFGRVFKIVNCDKFTRTFLNKLGIPVPDPINVPADPYTKHREKTFEQVAPKKASYSADTRGKFLEYNRKVLRFFGYWDDRETLYGLLHKLTINFYLEDDTIEIQEEIPVNSGRDCGSMFLHKSKLPKIFEQIPQPGDTSLFTVLNVLGKDFQRARYIPDPLNCGMVKTECYKENDLAIGAILNCFGRKIVITDCDFFTKEYYRKKYGIDDFTPLKYPDDDSEPVCREPVERELPPWNGYGTFEDSAGNCKKVIPEAPKINFHNFFQLDRQGLDGKVLRFQSRMIHQFPENRERNFLISYYLSDDTISVFESARRNSGFDSAMFYARSKMYKPNQDFFVSKEPDHYTWEDLWVGNTIVLHNYKFYLVDADEYTFHYMEANCEQFKKSNVKIVIDKIREALRSNYQHFVTECLEKYSKCGLIDYCQFRRAIMSVICKNISEQEIITLARYYHVKSGDDRFTKETLRSIVHTELKRSLFDGFDRFLESLRHMDSKHCCHLKREEVYAICRGCRLPLDVDILNAVLSKIITNEEGLLNYMDLVQFLDYKRCSAPFCIPDDYRTYLSPYAEKKATIVRFVDLERFLKDIHLQSSDKEDIPHEQPIENPTEQKEIT